MTSSYAWWERHGPRLPSHGIKAHTRRGAFATSWWASRWIAALERLVNASRLARGRTYARAGQVVALDVGRDGVKAQVQGSRARPYRVRIEFKRLTDDEWDRVIAAMAAEAIYAARLLSGEMPEQIEDVFAAAGTSLFPAQANDMRTTCSCPDLANPCKHIAAVHYLLGERFDEDPFLIFQARGRTREQIIAALRARRDDGEPGATEPSSAPVEVAPPLENLLATFYQAGPEIDSIAPQIAAPAVAAASLKRFGAAPAEADDDLRRIYAAATAYALERVLGDEQQGEDGK